MCGLFLYLPSSKGLVVKPDQLIKGRGKLGLVGIDLDLQGVREWLSNHLMKETNVSSDHLVRILTLYCCYINRLNCCFTLVH